VAQKILTSPSSFGQVGDEPVNMLIGKGYEVINNPFGRKLTEAETIELAKDCVGIVAGVESFNSQVIDSLPFLKCISRVGVGMDSVDIAYAEQREIVVINTPDGPTRSVAELTLGMTMSILRRIPQADSAIKNRRWEKQIGNLLFGKTIGVIGLGRIGKMVAQMFRALGNNVIGYDLLPDENWAKDNDIELDNLNSLLSASDIVTVHIPGGTGHSAVIGSEELNLLRKGAFFINISRGNVVDEKPLFDLLNSNHLSGAAIDVYSNEPYKGPLCDLDNVILTPHIGSYAAEGKLQMEIDAVQNLIDILEVQHR
jgi:D-3-phosphoglycerate dehydrogenase / 2-oxoglutarate reductase